MLECQRKDFIAHFKSKRFFKISFLYISKQGSKIVFAEGFHCVRSLAQVYMITLFMQFSQARKLRPEHLKASRLKPFAIAVIIWGDFHGSAIE